MAAQRAGVARGQLLRAERPCHLVVGTELEAEHELIDVRKHANDRLVEIADQAEAKPKWSELLT